MKTKLAFFILAISLVLLPVCGSSSSNTDTTAQLLNEATINGSSWTAQFTIAGVTMSSATGVWSPVTKLNNCESQNGTVLNAPAGYNNIVFGVTIACGEHNLFKLCLDTAANSVCMKGGTGAKQ